MRKKFKFNSKTFDIITGIIAGILYPFYFLKVLIFGDNEK